MSTAQVCECGHAVTMHPDGRIGKRRLDGEWSCLDPYCRCTRTQASFQVVVPPDPDICSCGHGRAMHFDEDGDHNGPCLWQVHNDAPFCKCDMWHRKPSEDEFLGVPLSEWQQIQAEINHRRGPDGSLFKRFRELLEVSDMRAALLKKRSAPAPCDSCSLAWDLIANAHDGDWERARTKWKDAAERWRDAWLSNPHKHTAPAAPSPSLAAPACAEKIIRAAERIDWTQMMMNGGGACFNVEDDGRFCCRAFTWAGHQGDKAMHLYEPLHVAMTRIAKALDVSPSLAALLEAGDAMRDFIDPERDPANRSGRSVMDAWDRSRAALPKAGAQ